MTMPAEHELIGTAEAARILQVDKTTLTRWAADGRIKPIVKMPSKNGAFLFNRSDVEALLSQSDGAA